MTELPPWLTPIQFAKLIQVSRQSVHRWIDDGTIEALQIGAVKRISVTELDRFRTKAKRDSEAES